MERQTERRKSSQKQKQQFHENIDFLTTNSKESFSQEKTPVLSPKRDKFTFND
jgi:hypothetical protein